MPGPVLPTALSLRNFNNILFEITGNVSGGIATLFPQSYGATVAWDAQGQRLSITPNAVPMPTGIMLEATIFDPNGAKTLTWHMYPTPGGADILSYDETGTLVDISFFNIAIRFSD